jgi:hypothetical protein
LCWPGRGSSTANVRPPTGSSNAVSVALRTFAGINALRG